jgi:hypothetical protein
MKRSALYLILMLTTLCVAAQQETQHPPKGAPLAAAPLAVGTPNPPPQPIPVPQDRLPAVLQAEYAVVVAVKDRDNLILQLRLLLHVPNDYTWDANGLRFIPPAPAEPGKKDAGKRDSDPQPPAK